MERYRSGQETTIARESGQDRYLRKNSGKEKKSRPLTSLQSSLIDYGTGAVSSTQNTQGRWYPNRSSTLFTGSCSSQFRVPEEDGSQRKNLRKEERSRHLTILPSSLIAHRSIAPEQLVLRLRAPKKDVTLGYNRVYHRSS